ncbi:hypothetical protein KY343_06505, partial [Candidatus Woesearchaeota archaeon]|nr:hypothetical protein [Candidatus Woesearchaeota archaeon]
FILLMIFLAPFVHAAPNPEIDITPIDLYETNEQKFNLTVNNLFGNETIEEVRVTMPGFTITDSVVFLGWDNTFSDEIIRWYDGSIETNIFGALFQYTAKAEIVGDDTTSNIEIIIIGESSEETTFTIPVEIRNDDTSPLLSNNTPEDGSFLRTGMIDQEISVYAEDPETGINTARLTYWPCNDTNLTENLVLDCDNNTCSNQLDLLEYEEGDLMCFEFVVHNYALESSSLTGSVGFDGTAPSIDLIAPADNEYGSSNTIFSFNASDNLAPTLTCSLIVDDETIDSAESNNGEITETTYDMTNVSEGNHEWIVRCTDWVGLSADSETRNIIIDNTAPTITLNSPANGSLIGSDVIIDIEVSDNYELVDVDYSSSLNSSELPEGENIIIVTAEDGAGNIAVEEFTFIVDRTAPTISLIAPADGTSSDVHVNFLFDIFDNLDNELNCTIFADNNPIAAESLDISAIANITLVLPMDEYEWYVQCQDDALNSAATESRTLNVTDLTGPTIISDITYVARIEDYTVEANITDISGVDNVDMEFNSTSLSVISDGDIYSATIQTDVSYDLGDYTLEITAEDGFGNTNIVYDTFTLIQGYDIDMQLTPSTTKPGKKVTVSGTVELDDGNEAPEDIITLELPEETINISIENGTFEYEFDAPDEGEYIINAFVTSSEGFEHTRKVLLEVESNSNKQKDKSNSFRSSPLRVGTYCGDGICQSDETCKKCSKDCGECPKETGPIEPFVEGHSSKVEAKSIHPQNPSSDLEAHVIKGKKGLLESLFGGITGFAVGGDGSGISSPWALILIFAIIAGLYAAVSIKKLPKNPKSKLNWDNYFEKRR